MKKQIILSLAAALGVTVASAGKYNVTLQVPQNFEEVMAYMVNFDTSQPIDSVKIKDQKAVFTGEIDEPVVARFLVEGNRMGQFILEEGEITVDPKNKSITGGKLNTANQQLNNGIAALSGKFHQAQTEEERDAIYAEYEALTDKVFKENLNNPIGYMIFMDKASEMELADLTAFVDQNPYFKKFTRVNNLIESARRKAATSEGGKFVDFEIEYDGVKHKLSDVVGKGDYVLVDFWASWCGPCIVQTAVLKDIYNKYKDDGRLKVLGVAVWDEPENTIKAIEQHQLPWESWLNGQNVPTDAYGIAGIPCIILFGPDGTILSRDKQSDELKAAVDAALQR